MLNVPGIVVAAVVVLVGVHLYRLYVLSVGEEQQFLLAFAFFPGRFDVDVITRYPEAFPSGEIGKFFTFISYSFLHADWLHLIINGFWMMIFGSALARRFGALRFLLISVLGSIAGAGLHLLFNFGSVVPMVGASAAISAHMACAARFAFVPYGPLGRPRSDHPGAFFLPSLSIAGMMKNPQVLSFLGIWFALNLLFGVGSNVVGGEQSIAWQAHIGGFLTGLLLFPFFDPGLKDSHQL